MSGRLGSLISLLPSRPLCYNRHCIPHPRFSPRGSMTKISRRLFGQSAAVTAAAAASGLSLPSFSFAQSNPAGASLRFPSSFKWGCATAAYQVEGGAARRWPRSFALGRLFAHAGQNPQRRHRRRGRRFLPPLQGRRAACSRTSASNTYRMSISWSRIFPNGKGEPNPAGLDYYKPRHR